MSYQVFIDDDEVVCLSGTAVESNRVIKPDGHVHIIPISTLFNHADSSCCGCNPVWDEYNRLEYFGGYAELQVWLHKSDRELMQ